MISRRRILSRSRDDLNSDSGVGFAVQVEEEEDVWYNKDKLYKVRSFCALSTVFTSHPVETRAVARTNGANGNKPK